MLIPKIRLEVFFLPIKKILCTYQSKIHISEFLLTIIPNKPRFLS